MPRLYVHFDLQYDCIFMTSEIKLADVGKFTFGILR